MQHNGTLSVGGYLDLIKNELRNARLQNLASDPSSPLEGQIYYNTVTKKKRTFNGATWDEDITSAGGTGDVSGQASSVDSEIALFSGTTGKAIKRAAGSGLVKAVSGVISYVTTLSVADGGTGAATLTGVLKGNGTSAVTGGATLTDLGNPTADRAMGGFKITGLADGTSAQDAVTKAQLDLASQGNVAKYNVKAATTANITLSAPQTIDGVSVIANDRVLVKNQTAGQDNGIYVVNAGAWTRATDADTTAEVQAGASVFVDQGTVNANTQWTQNDTIATIGTTVQTWTKTFDLATLALQGFTKKWAQDFGNGSLTSFTITHNLGTLDVQVSVYLKSSGALELCETVAATTNTVTLSGWATAPASNAYRCVVTG